MPAHRKYPLGTCARCGKEQPDDNWYARGDGLALNRSHCKQCVAEAGRESRLRLQYGLTVEEYDRILAHQGGTCAVCDRPPGAKRLAVDHDHKTGLIRGLLCWTCNTALGKFKDDAARLNRAAAYVNDPPASTALGRDVFGRVGRVTNKKRKPRRKNG